MTMKGIGTQQNLKPLIVTIIGSDNGLPPDRHQAIIWTNVSFISELQGRCVYIPYCCCQQFRVI